MSTVARKLYDLMFPLEMAVALAAGVCCFFVGCVSPFLKSFVYTCLYYYSC